MDETPHAESSPLTTPDGRYVVVRGRLWRAANPKLAPAVRAALVNELMAARREIRAAARAADAERLAATRAAVHAAKVALGARGPVWWADGARDFSRHRIENTPYAQWYRNVAAS
jgi:predicted exporter